MNASIIVLTYNSSKYLKSCLDSILKNKDEEDELIIIDNNSVDETRKLLNAYKNKAEIYLLSKNLKISYSRNLGAKYAKNDLLVFIDSDLVLDDDALKKAKTSFKFFNAAVLFGYYKEVGTGYDWYIEMTRDIFSRKRKEKLKKEINYKNFACLSGGLCLIDKKIFFKYSGFNTYYNNSPSEDIDLELKLIRDNEKIIYEKKFSGIHYKGNVSFKDLIKKYANNGKAVAKLIKSSIKNRYRIPFNSRWPYLPIIVLIELTIFLFSFYYHYLYLFLLLIIFYRIKSILLYKDYSLIFKIRFILIRFMLDYIMLVSLIKNFIINRKEINKNKFNIKKI